MACKYLLIPHTRPEYQLRGGSSRPLYPLRKQDCTKTKPRRKTKKYFRSSCYWGGGGSLLKTLPLAPHPISAQVVTLGLPRTISSQQRATNHSPLFSWKQSSLLGSEPCSEGWLRRERERERLGRNEKLRQWGGRT
jgi:hypothetical protein